MVSKSVFVHNSPNVCQFLLSLYFSLSLKAKKISVFPITSSGVAISKPLQIALFAYKLS